MWIVPTLVGFAVLAWLGYAWMHALFVKYEHTVESAAILAALAVGSVYSGWRTAGSIAPGWSIGPRMAVTLAVGFTVFSVFSYLVASLWTALLTRSFDESEAALLEEEDTILRRLESMRFQVHRTFSQPAEDVAAGEAAVQRDPKEDLRKSIEAWEQGGGAARVRSLKVLEWREEASAKSPSELREAVRSLEVELAAETEEAKKEQAKIRLAVNMLALFEKEPPVEKPVKKAPKVELKADEATLRERLQQIQRELQTVKNAKAQYLRSRVRLTWRSKT